MAKPVSFAQWGALLQTRYDGCQVAYVAQETGFAPLWQMSAHPTLFASPVTLTAISSSILPSFTWTSQIIINKTRTNDSFQCLMTFRKRLNFVVKWFVLGTVINMRIKILCMIKKQLIRPLQARKTAVKCKHIDANASRTLKDKIKESQSIFKVTWSQRASLIWRTSNAVSTINIAIFVYLLLEIIACGSPIQKSSNHCLQVKSC